MATTAVPGTTLAVSRVEVGQVWETRDARDSGRRIRIVECDGFLGFGGYATGETIAFPYHSWKVGRRTRLRELSLYERWTLVSRPGK